MLLTGISLERFGFIFNIQDILNIMFSRKLNCCFKKNLKMYQVEEPFLASEKIERF